MTKSNLTHNTVKQREIIQADSTIIRWSNDIISNCTSNQLICCGIINLNSFIYICNKRKTSTSYIFRGATGGKIVDTLFVRNAQTKLFSSGSSDFVNCAFCGNSFAAPYKIENCNQNIDSIEIRACEARSFEFSQTSKPRHYILTIMILTVSQ